MSSIFVIDFASFSHMSAKEVQDIYRERHILVVGVPTEQMSFNPEGLATLGSLVLPRQGQGAQVRSCIVPQYLQFEISVAAKRSKEDPNASLHLGSLLDLYNLSKDTDRTHSVNMLDLPMGDTSVGIPPQFRYVIIKVLRSNS
jgi:hypothetical protein